MKNIFLFCVLSVVAAISYAQPTNSGFQSAIDQMRLSQIIRNLREAIQLTPVSTRMCFDETINVDMTFGRLNMKQALFMNSDDGYIGYTKPGINGAGPNDVITPAAEDFHLGIFGFKGNAYNYYNKRDDRTPEIHHWVMTGNTEEHKFVIADAMLSGPLQRKTEQRLYCDGYALAQCYKLGDQPTTWFLYGDRYPEELHIRKYFGGFGVGIVRADEGIYVVMEVQAGNNHARIMSINKQHTCFDPSIFVPAEDNYRDKERTRLDREEANLNRRAEEAGRERHCVSQRLAIINLEREQITQGRRALDSTRHGNIYQDRTTQKAFIGMMDPLQAVQQEVLNCNLSICLCDSDTTGSPIVQEKKLCEQRRLQVFTRLTQQMRDMDRQYPNVAEAHARKMKLYAESMREVKCD